MVRVNSDSIPLSHGMDYELAMPLRDNVTQCTSLPKPSFPWGITSLEGIHQGVCYGDGVFVAVNRSLTGQRAAYSYDGANWSYADTPVDNAWYSVCYGNGLFVAVATTGTLNRVMTSPNGIDWTIRDTPVDNPWASVCYGDGLFVAVSYSGSLNRVMTSDNGIDWTIRVTPVDLPWISVCYGNGLFVAVSGASTSNGVMTSSNGVDWLQGSTPLTAYLSAVCYGNGMFITVTSNIISPYIIQSYNGVDWSKISLPFYSTFYAVCYTGSYFYAVGGTGSNTAGPSAAISSDGLLWSESHLEQPVDNSRDISVCSGDGKIVSVDFTGYVKYAVATLQYTPSGKQSTTYLIDTPTISRFGKSSYLFDQTHSQVATLYPYKGGPVFPPYNTTWHVGLYYTPSNASSVVRNLLTQHATNRYMTRVSLLIDDFSRITWQFRYLNAVRVNILSSGLDWVVGSTYYICVQRVGNGYTIYRNGVVVAALTSTYKAFIGNPGTPIYVGAVDSGTWGGQPNGCVENVEITSGYLLDPAGDKMGVF